MKGILSLILSLLLSIVSLRAQLLPENLHFQRINTEKKMPKLNVFSIIEDQNGFIWSGTNDGLYRYDGQQAKAYKANKTDPNSSISSNYIFHLYPSKKGGFWIGTIDGLNYYNSQTNRFLHWKKDKEDPNSLPENEIEQVFESKEGEVWLSLSKGGVLYFDQEKESFKDIDSTLINKITQKIIEDDQGKLWLLHVWGGLSIYDPSSKQLIHDHPQFSALKPLQNEEIAEMIEDHEGNMLLATPTYLYKYDSKKNVLTTLLNNRVHDLAYFYGMIEDQQNRIWIGTNEGTYVYHPKLNQLQHYIHDANYSWTLNSSSINTFFRDSKDNLWIGTSLGLNLLDPFSIHFEHLVIPKAEGLPNSNRINNIALDQQHLWISTPQGFCYYDIATRTYQPAPHFFTDTERKTATIALHRDHQGSIWIGQNNNLMQYDPTTNQLTRWNNQKNKAGQPLHFFTMLDIDQDSSGTMWLGTLRSGLIKLNKETKEFEYLRWNKNIQFANDSANAPPIRDLQFMPNGKMLIATSYGFYQFNPQSKALKLFPFDDKDSTKLDVDATSYLYQDSKEQIWVATFSNLHLFNESMGTFKSVSEQFELEGEQVRVIEEDMMGNKWFGASNTIVKWDEQQNKLLKFDEADGIVNKVSHHAKDENGYLYFSGNGGITRFHPDSINENTTPPKIVLTNFLLFNKSVNDTFLLPKSIWATKEITLTHDQSIFSFEFSALNYRQSHKVKYKYKLEGFNQNWVETDASLSRATFTNLDAGTYTFMVKAANDDGFWNETPSTIRVIVLPPWYLTWWAKSLWVFIIIGSALSFYFWRVTSLERQKLVLEKQVKERTLQINNQKEEIIQQAEELKSSNEKLIQLNQFKEDMGGMIVHDFKSPLNTILSYGKGNTKVHIAAKRLQHLLENFLDVHRNEEVGLQIDLQAVNMHDVLRDAIQQTEALITAKSIQLSTELPQELYVMADPELLLRIIENLLTNAIKYTPINGIINFTSTVLSDDQMRLGIQDSGEGISQDKLENIFQKYNQAALRKSGEIRSTGLGLTFCKIAVEAQGGSIWVESQKNEGSIFYFTLRTAQVTERTVTKKGIHQVKSSIQLTTEELQVIAPILAELQLEKNFQLGSLHKILNQVEISAEGNLANWKNALLTAYFEQNRERFKELLSFK